MTIYNFDINDLIRLVKVARSSAPESVRISINTGDLTLEQCRELKKAGVTGAYHANRMGEGVYNRLDPEVRKQTWRNMMAAGIEVSSGTEPIGPEHTMVEIVDNLFEGIEEGCLNGGVGTRLSVPGTPMGDMEMVSPKKYMYIASVLSIATIWYQPDSELNRYRFGFAGGGNKAYAEYGGNPRDTAVRSEENFGHTVEWCRRQLLKRGFEHILMADGSVQDLNEDYLIKTKSV